MPGKKGRQEIPVDVKLAIVRRYRNGESLRSLEIETGYQRVQIRNWAKQEANLSTLKNKKSRKRLSGSGPKPSFPEIEQQLLTWFQAKRDQKHQVSYESLAKQAKEIASELNVPVERFPCSKKWVQNFCRRHSIGSRRVTHRGQQDNRADTEIKKVAEHFLESVQQKTAGYSADKVFNMDETPCYFDMASDQTLHFKGDKNVDGTDTGHQKSRFTVVLCCSAEGKMVRALIIFKGLKNVPKLNLPAEIEVAVSLGGSMNGPLMDKWIRSCFAKRGRYFANTKSILFMDSYGTHKKLICFFYMLITHHTTIFLIIQQWLEPLI